MIPSYGATEAKVPDIVDAIVDLTETGSSLRKNGLRILDTLLTSYTELIANPAAFADPAKRAAMEDVALLLRGAIQARAGRTSPWFPRGRRDSVCSRSLSTARSCWSFRVAPTTG